MTRRPAALLVDIDNSVYPYAPCHAAGLDHSARVAGTVDARWKTRPVFEDDYHRARRAVKARVGRQAAGHCRLLYFKEMTLEASGRDAVGTARALHDAYWTGYFAAMAADAGCADTLALARARRVPVAWVSNFTTERQMLKLEALGLDGAADVLVTSEEAGAEKPDAAPFSLALTRLGVSASDAWMIGDDPLEDIRAARALGMTAIWFRRSDEDAREDDAHAVVRSWLDLRDRLESVTRG